MIERINKIFCISICLIVALLSGCDFHLEDRSSSALEPKQEQQETASVEGALAYMKFNCGKDNFDITFMNENIAKTYDEPLFNIDGAKAFLKDIPERTETCYLGYSPDEDMYFLIFHNTYSKEYRSSYETQLKYISKHDEAINWATAFWGKSFIKTDVHLYLYRNFPLSTKLELENIYSDPDPDVKSAYNRLLMDIDDPYVSEFVNTTKDGGNLGFRPCLNIYVNCTLEELYEQKEEIEQLNAITLYTLIIAIDGIYNRPNLTVDMLNGTSK